MLEDNLRQIIEEVVKNYYAESEAEQTQIEPAQEPQTSTSDPVSASIIEYDQVADITAYEMESFMRVPNPVNAEAYMNYKKKTPARVGIWRAGSRYTTETLLRFRADHAVAQDAVFSMVSEDIFAEKKWPILKTVITEKDEYLTRPDLGRILDEDASDFLKKAYTKPPKVLVYLSDGLSSTAIESNGYDAFKAIEMGLEAHNIKVGAPFFLKFGRVPAMDHVSEITGAEVTAVLIGERPGLATGESMSCYMIYKGKVGNPESLRTVISNIHKNGTPAVEAGAYIADIIKRILDAKKSGVDLKL